MKNLTTENLYNNLAKCVFNTLYYDHKSRTFREIKPQFYAALKGYGLVTPYIDGPWESLTIENADKDRTVTYGFKMEPMHDVGKVPIKNLCEDVEKWFTYDKQKQEELLFEYLHDNRPATTLTLVSMNGEKVYR